MFSDNIQKKLIEDIKNNFKSTTYPAYYAKWNKPFKTLDNKCQIGVGYQITFNINI